MTLRREPLTVEEVFQAALGECGGSWKVLADKLNKAGQDDSLRKSAIPSASAKGATFSYADARTLSARGVLAFAQDLAAQCGMALAPLEERDAAARDVLAKGAAMMKEAAEASATIAAACADDKIERHEKREILQQLHDLERVVQECKRTLGAGG
jgi:hypothetical protein